MAGRGPAYGAQGFLRFLDRLQAHGLEAFRLYYGIYRAQVVANDDSQNQGRIHVRVPSIGDRPGVRRLAYPKTPAAGNGYGFKNTPPVDSWVWVQFEGGRPDAAVWEAGVWGRDHVPELLRDPKSNGWITPRGNKLVLDDRDGEEFIRIEHRSGHKIDLDKDGNVSVSQLDGKKVNVGAGADQDAVRGNEWLSLQEELIDAILLITVPTAMGPSGTPNNAAQFQAIKQRLRNALSNVVKVK